MMTIVIIGVISKRYWWSKSNLHSNLHSKNVNNKLLLMCLMYIWIVNNCYLKTCADTYLLLKL